MPDSVPGGRASPSPGHGSSESQQSITFSVINVKRYARHYVSLGDSLSIDAYPAPDHQEQNDAPQPHSVSRPHLVGRLESGTIMLRMDVRMPSR
jgi:hypothetical protein